MRLRDAAAVDHLGMLSQYSPSLTLPTDVESRLPIRRWR
jgi:hypothetical protein